MAKLTDEQYLQNDIFECTYIIEQDFISIRSNGTIWSENKRVKNLPDKKEILALYKEVISLAKNVNCSISYKYKTKQNIINNYDNSILEIQKANAIFDNMVSVAREIEERKLHFGCSDDIKLNELHELAHLYCKIYHNSSYMIVSDMMHKLESFKNNFTNTFDGVPCKIFL